MSYMVPLKTKPEPDADARIALAACVVNDTVYVGWRHSAIMVEQLMPRGLVMTQHCQGFVDQHGFFWDREMSARIALAAKQTSVCHGVLVSEALWDMDGTPRSPSGPYNPLGDVKPSPPINAPVVLHDLVLRTTKLPDEGELRRLWTEAGGSFHGPNVEHGTMPEAKLLPFLGALVRERDDAFAEAKAQQDRRFEALRERDIAKASAQGACDDLTQQMARSDELAMKLAAAEKRAEAIQQYASDDRTLAQTYKRERDARYPLSPARYAELTAAESRAAALAEALQRIANMETSKPGLDPRFYGHAVKIAEDALAGNGNRTDDAPPVTPLHPVKDVGVQVENKKTGKRHEWDGTAWRPVPAPLGEVARLRAVIEWFAGDDTGISSEAIARTAVGLFPFTSSFGPRPPSDGADRGRCVRLLRRFPWMLPALATLESAGGEWRTQGKLIREGLVAATVAAKEKQE